MARRREYRRLLYESFARLAKYPGIGRLRPVYGVDLRSLSVGQHVVVYVPTERELTIVRVLHHRRDVELGPDDALT